MSSRSIIDSDNFIPLAFFICTIVAILGMCIVGSFDAYYETQKARAAMENGYVQNDDGRWVKEERD